MKAASTLGDILQKLDSALSVLEQWEKREDTSGLRSRWSQKDQKRHGEKLQTLNMKCKTNVQFLRMQQSRLKEQRRTAEQQHSNLLSYKQLLEARTSTQTAADVRLFTYVTIIFLPLSFSSSLFSMAGAPTYKTVYVMVATTAIALLTTFLLLANLKLMDRHLRSQIGKLNSTTRKKMRAEQSDYWDKISEELEKNNQRKFVVRNLSKRLPAESQWYYTIFWLKSALQSTIFWLTSALKSPRSYVRAGVWAQQAYSENSMSGVLFAFKTLAALFFIPISVLVFFIYEIIITATDTIYLLSVLVRQLIKKTLKSSKTIASTLGVLVDKLLQAEGRKLVAEDRSERSAGEGDRVESAPQAGFSKQKASTSGFLRVTMDALLQRLESPPRPIRGYTSKLNPSTEGIQELISTADAISHKVEYSEYERDLLQLRQQYERERMSPPRSIEIEKETSVAEDGVFKTNGEEDGKDVVTSDTPQERPQRLKKLLGRSRKPDDGTQEPQMRVGWSLV